MLADSGDIEAAIGLLIRGARLSSDPDEQMSQDAADSETGYGWTRRSGADSQLYDLLLQSGRFEGTVATLVEQSKQDPADAALAYLIADLLTRGERWMQLGQFIKEHEKSQSDLRLMFLSVRAFCEQGRWDEALASLEQVKRLAATRPDRLQVFEAYIRMMKGDRGGAIAAVASLHDERSIREFMGGPTWRAAASVVSVAGSAAQATEVLSRHLQNGELPAYDHELLTRMLAASGDWGASAHFALQRLWQEQGQLGPSNAWWRTITDLGAAAARAGVSLRFDGARPEDDAMLTLISGDPSGAFGSFGSIASKPDASLDALRGLVAAAHLSGDDNAALAANTRLLEWVGARRDHGWYNQPAPTVQWMAQVALASAPGTSSTQLTYGGVAQALNQVIGTLATTVGTVVTGSTSQSSSKRSPLHRRAIRRLPGQGLAEHLHDEQFASIAIWLGLALGVLIAAALDIGIRLSTGERMGWHMVVMLVVGLSMAAWSIRRALKMARHVQLGLAGEIGVAQTLESLTPLGYRVLHDLQPDADSTRGMRTDGSGPNIDHVIVGPGGVFVIETKTRSKRINGAANAKVRYDGSQVWVDGVLPERNPVEQARAAAADVQRFLTQALGSSPAIRPVVLFPGWFVDASEARNAEVWVLTDTAFPKWIEHEHQRGGRLDVGSVQRIAEVLASRSQWRHAGSLRQLKSEPIR